MTFANIGSLETLICNYADGVATIILNRPERMNAVSQQMHADLRTALDVIETDDAVRCMVLTGTGRAFCSGQDLTEGLANGDDGKPDLGTALDRDYNPLVARIMGLEIPTIAAVNGMAAGAGANLALICDIVLAGESAKFVQAFARIALVPDCGGTWVLPRIVGRQRALSMMLSAAPVDAATARDFGMVWMVCPDNALAGETQALAAAMASGPTATYAMIKQAVDASWNNDLGQQLTLERNLQAVCGRLDDFAEGVAAFGEKRPPVFKGK